jgi:MFS family permease
MIWPILPGFLSEIVGGDGSVMSSGVAFAVMGLASAASSLGTAQVGERIGLKKLIVVCAAFAGLFYIPMQFVNAAYQVIIVIGIAGLFSGAMLSSTNALLGLAVPAEQHGRAFGASQSAIALAIATGPILGGAMATAIGLRQVFLVMTSIFLLVSLASIKVVTIRGHKEAQAAGPGPPATAPK